jgi:hypothetical protein
VSNPEKHQKVRSKGNYWGEHAIEGRKVEALLFLLNPKTGKNINKKELK